jgi:segregation and condensation protein A
VEKKILDIVINEQVSWKALLMKLVKEEGMDPWDINIGNLTQQYIQSVKSLKEANLNISGKVLLAAAILLRIKSTRLVNDDLAEFDQLLTPPVEEEAFYDSLEQELRTKEVHDHNYELHPRIPQPRKRKVSIFDLVNALEKALEVKHRRINRIDEVNVEIPDHVDINEAIDSVWGRITDWFTRVKEKLTFRNLLKEDTKKEKIGVFQPLLHLAHNRKVYLKQDKPFGPIEILKEEPHED